MVCACVLVYLGSHLQNPVVLSKHRRLERNVRIYPHTHTDAYMHRSLYIIRRLHFIVPITTQTPPPSTSMRGRVRSTEQHTPPPVAWRTLACSGTGEVFPWTHRRLGGFGARPTGMVANRSICASTLLRLRACVCVYAAPCYWSEKIGTFLLAANASSDGGRGWCVRMGF